MATADTFILLANVSNPRALTVLSTESNRPIVEIVPRGKGIGNCLSIAAILNTSDKDVVWLQDVTAGKFIKIDLRKAVKADNYLGEKEFRANNPTSAVKSPCWINDSMYAGCSYFSDEERFILFNDSFQTSKRIGVLPPSLSGWPKENPKGKFALRALCYSGDLVKHPGKNSYAFAYNKTSRIDFYDSSTLIKVIRGPELFDPEYEFRENEGVNIPKDYKETMISFISMQADDNYIYLLYSGRKRKFSCGRELLVLDWNGNPVKRYNLADNFKLFSIMKKENGTRIYTINNKTKELEYSDISI